MEELQDAIEDVQYLQAVNSKDSGPSPTEPWPFPSEKALEEFNTERLQLDQRFYSLETICSGILGLYLVGVFTELLNVNSSSSLVHVPSYSPIQHYLISWCLTGFWSTTVLLSVSIVFVLVAVTSCPVWQVLCRAQRTQQVRLHAGRHTISGKGFRVVVA